MRLTRTPSRVLMSLGLALMAGLSAAPALADDVLRLRFNGDIQQFDPIWTTNYTVRNAAYMVWDTLFATDGNFEVQPQMVDTYEVSADGLTYTMTLREGLKWHDGTDVTAADCVASLKRWGAKDAIGKLMMTKTADIAAVDERTFTITLSEPWGFVLQALGKISSNVPFMMPERIAATSPDEAITEYVGSGPFRLVREEWQPGVKIVFEKFADYVPRSEPASGAAGGKVAKVDRIEAVYIPDTVTAVNAMVAGEIDWMEVVPPDMLPIVESAGDITVYAYDPVGGSLQIVLNSLHPPLDDIKVRQAVAQAVDQAAFHQAIVGGRTELYGECGAIFTCGNPLEFSVGAQDQVRKDVDRAKALLAEAGYDGTPVTIIHPTDIKVNSDASYVLAEALKQVGFTVDTQLTDWASVASRRASKAPVAEGGWNIFVTGWSGTDLMNPLTNVFVTGACDAAWFGWACSEVLQGLLKDYVAAVDPEEQKAIAEKMQEEAWRIVPFVTLGKINQPSAYRTATTGWLTAPVPFFWNVEKTD
ncbi:MAG: ABC transporter substrate-binding protein [Devosia sp.]